MRDRLKSITIAEFAGDLLLEVLEVADSKCNDLLQTAVVFSASINRMIDPSDSAPKIPGAKDGLARDVVARTAVALSVEAEGEYEDLTVRINL